jgi:hypothetical protein
MYALRDVINKTTMKKVLGNGLLVVSFGLFAFLVSCNDDSFKISSDDSNTVQSESSTEIYFEDVDDMSALAISADASTSTGSRESSAGRAGVKPSDVRFTCATITFEFANDNSVDVPHGYITIDFGVGCTDARGNVRKGIINIEFIGRRFLPNSKIITTLDNYSINDIKLEGTRTVTNSSTSLEDNPKFTITVQNGKATWPDATFATRESNHTREWNILGGEWYVTGNAAGTNRNGKTYQVEITKQLVYRRECASTAKIFMAVEGTKVLTVDGKVITIDYGDGTCDKTITITIDGESKNIDVTAGN